MFGPRFRRDIAETVEHAIEYAVLVMVFFGIAALARELKFTAPAPIDTVIEWLPWIALAFLLAEFLIRRVVNGWFDLQDLIKERQARLRAL